MDNEYNREKTLAVLTGLVCVLVFLAGTALGGYHAFTIVNVFAGLLALASYGLADVAVAWGSYIDYKESGGAMEWTAWVVKYVLSFYLLFSGGCIAYTLFYTSEGAASRTEIQQRASKAQSECLAADGSQKGRNVACQRVYDSTFAAGMGELNKKAEGETSAESSIKKFIAFPLFHYLPGILGLCGILAFTLVSKLTTNYESPGESPGESPRQSPVRLRMQNQAPFRVGNSTAYPKVEQGGYVYTFKSSGSGYQLHVRRRGENSKLVSYVSAPETAVLAGMDFESLANWALEKRLTNHGEDSVVGIIRESLVAPLP